MKNLLWAPLALSSRQESSSTSGGLNYNAAPPNLSTLPDNSLFETWRPRAHVLPPSGHIGDPCMHYSDPYTGLFHVGYLSKNSASGATSDDLVTYTDLRPGDPAFIRNGSINDPVAVFDGSVIPMGINGSATLVYTSVSYLPIHWTIPYTKGSETVSLAVTHNGGKDFTKLEQGPVIPGPPYGSNALNVTGFRDPYVFQDPGLDRALGSEDGVWYSVISGGVHDVGSSQFLYRQVDPEFRDWDFIGQWWQEPANASWGDGTWAGRWGFNMEVANPTRLDTQGHNPEGDLFITLGTEGGQAPVPLQQSPDRQMLWASGNLTTLNGSVKFEPQMAGKLDWGRSSYAAAGKEIPANSSASKKSSAPDRFVSYVWLTNDGFEQIDFPVDQQGWDGSLLLPRELSVGTISNVVDNELVHETASWKVASRRPSNGTVELTTLRQRMVREAVTAFTSNTTRTISEPGRTVNSTGTTAFRQSPSSRFYMMTASISFPVGARQSNDLKAGFEILSSQYESTMIYYQFSNETMFIDRSNSSAANLTTNGIVTIPEAGKLRLFDIAGEKGYSKTQEGSHIETLDLTILVDNGIVEVWANDRFVMSTWVWAWYASSNNISFYHEGSMSVEFGNATIYEGLVDAWPERSQ